MVLLISMVYSRKAEGCQEKGVPDKFLREAVLFLRLTRGFVAKLHRRTLKGTYARGPSRKLGAIRPPCELELAFQTPDELKILNLKLKFKGEDQRVS